MIWRGFAAMRHFRCPIHHHEDEEVGTLHRPLTHVPEVQVTAGERISGGGPSWESDLADLAHVPLTAFDTLTPLGRTDRLLAEVLRPRSSMRGGGEPGRAE